MYTVTIDEKMQATFAWAQGRYGWGDFPTLEIGTHEIPEHELWEWRESVESDTEGGHSLFPGLDTNSETGEKIVDLYFSIV